MIDGRRTEEELLRNVAGLGLGIDALNELLEGEFIVLSTSYATIAVAPVVAVAAAARPAPVPVPAPAPAPTLAPVFATQAKQFQALYEFYNKTIKSTIGLRGFTLQLKVEKASSVEELRELRMPYLEAVQRAKGNFAAASLAEQLDQLLDQGPAQA